MTIPTAAQRADTNPIMKEWVAAKDKENAASQPTTMPGAVGAGASVGLPKGSVPPPVTPTLPGGSGGGGWMGVAGAINMANNALPGAAAGAQAGIPSTGIPTTGNTPVVSSSGTNSQPSGLNNAQSYIDMLNDAKKKASYAALEKARNNALSNLNQEKAGIQPKYNDQKNQVASGSQQNARNFAEYMAARGGTSSGAGAQAEISRNIGTQGSLNSLGQQEIAAYDDIARRTTDINNNYESDKVAADASNEAERMKLLLDNYYSAQTRGDTLAQNDILNKLQEAQMKLQQSGQSFNQNLQTKQYDKDVSDTTFNQNLATTQQKQNEANTKFAQGMQLDAVIYQKARDSIADKNYQTEFENNIKQQGFENALKIAVQQHQISNDNAQIAISQQNARTSAASQQNSANNSKQGQLMDIWKATGKAPAGINGVPEGTAYGSDAEISAFGGNIAGELAQAQSRDDVLAFFNNPTNAALITGKLGADAATKMKNDALARFDKVTPVDNQNMSIREKAIAAAQKDTRWNVTGTNRSALINEYEAYYR